MSIFTCSECQGTFHYNEESPVEWKPHHLHQASTDTYKTACLPCFNIASAKTAEAPVSAAGYDIEEVVRMTYLKAGGMQSSYAAWCRKWGTIERRAAFLQTHYKWQWKNAYRTITGREWTP